MGLLSRKKRIRREQGITRAKRERLDPEPQYAGGCWCGAAIEHGAKLCRYCQMREDAEDVRLARAALQEAREHGIMSWNDVKEQLGLDKESA